MAVAVAALRRISNVCLLRNPNPPRFHLPYYQFQFVSARGFASKVFVAGLSFLTTEQRLTEAFSQCGQVIKTKVVMNILKSSTGYAFVTFASLDEADRAVSEMNGKILNGRTVSVEHATATLPRGEAFPIARPPPGLPSNK